MIALTDFCMRSLMAKNWYYEFADGFDGVIFPTIGDGKPCLSSTSVSFKVYPDDICLLRSWIDDEQMWRARSRQFSVDAFRIYNDIANEGRN